MLIEIEGPSGAGKTTLIASLCTDRHLAGRVVIDAASLERTTDDIGWRLGELMRQHGHPIDPVEQVLLYCARTAARARLALSHDDQAMVLCDRLRLSLQVATHHVQLSEPVRELLVDLALRQVQPDLVVLLDVSYPAHRRRLAKRGHHPEPARSFDVTRRLFTSAFGQHTGAKRLVDTTHLTPDQVCSTVVPYLLSTRTAA
jgi:thymidylate kinase